jgi:small-conductance mechanosensitive channel
MDITVRKNHSNSDKTAKKSTKRTFLVSGYFLFLFAFIIARFILNDENLRIYGSFAYKEVLQKISLGGAITCLILIIVKWVERLVIKKFKAPEHYNLVRILRLISLLLIALVIISILFVNWYAAAVSFGVISLILSFSLQTPLTSLIAWVYILSRSPYRVGDRIKINSFKGDVVEVNYMDTTLWEIGGDYLTNDVPSGKLIRFPNSLVLQNAVFNYSWKRFPFIWNEVSVYVPYESNLEEVEKVMKEITARELGTERTKRIKDFKEVVKHTSVDENDIKEHPFVTFNIEGETWIQAIVTYPVEAKLAGELRNRLIKGIMKELKIIPE